MTTTRGHPMNTDVSGAITRAFQTVRLAKRACVHRVVNATVHETIGDRTTREVWTAPEDVVTEAFQRARRGSRR